MYVVLQIFSSVPATLPDGRGATRHSEAWPHPPPRSTADMIALYCCHGVASNPSHRSVTEGALQYWGVSATIGKVCSDLRWARVSTHSQLLRLVCGHINNEKVSIS